MVRFFEQMKGREKEKEKIFSLLQHRRWPPTALLVGQGGIGKCFFAFAVAQALACERDLLACGKCPSCVRFSKKQSEGLLFVSAEGGHQIKLEQAKKAIDFVQLKVLGQARIVIIEDAHLLNTQSANTLLKSLEEPPPQTYFILTALSGQSVLPTIRSRCQLVRLGALSRADIAKQLGEDQQKEEWMIEASMGRLDILDQLRNPQTREQRQTVMGLWSELMEHPSGRFVQSLIDLNLNQSESLRACQWLRQLLRDACFQHHGLQPLIHLDFSRLIERLAKLDEELLHWFHDELLKLEEGFLKNWDRHLAWEDFFIRAQAALKGEPNGKW